MASISTLFTSTCGVCKTVVSSSSTFPLISPFAPSVSCFVHRKRSFQPLTFSRGKVPGVELRKERWIIRALDGETVVSEAAETTEGGEAVEDPVSEGEQQQAVSIPVSPSDILTMYFEAEGTISESAVPSVTEALEESEGVTDVKVRVAEGIATVQLKKQTTVQATGEASKLVEIIQGAGFKLQALNLSFDDEEDLVPAA